jgi:hypothetical protein
MDSLDLDISWIDKHERMNNIHKNYQREPMDSIKICYIYVNLDSEIEKVVYENEILGKIDTTNNCIIPKERILQIVQNKKMLTASLKYSIDTILVYNVCIEPENIQKYVNSENGIPFLQVYPIVDEILIQPSIFIFHEINCIYFIFKQIDVKPMPKSILKTGGGNGIKTGGNGIKTGGNGIKTGGNGIKTGGNGKKTKRVRIQEVPDVKHNMTKKKL